MSQKKYPTLTPSEVQSILKRLGFTKDRKEGSHEQWECPRTDQHPRSVVTVDVGYPNFDDKRIKNMIRQSNRSREEFYGATKRTAQRAAVPVLKAGISPEPD
jgi:predicted RNA binding protein YcfA (HicA-like mRNA interferase family)